MKEMIKLLLILISLVSFWPAGVLAQEEILEAKVIESLEEDVVTQAGKQSLYQKLKLTVTKGSLQGQEIIVEVGNIPLVGQPKYQPGDTVLVSFSRDFEGETVFYITDFVRRRPLILLFLFFVILAVVVGKWRGLNSLLGLLASFLVIFKLILPQIDAGHDPVLVAVTGAALIIPLTFYLSHGLNRKTTVAMVGTFVSLLITAFLAKIFIQTARLTGYASEEAAFLQVAKGGVMNIRGLILAGIIIGSLGVLDDVTVSQAAIIEQLKEANPKMKTKELFDRAMKIGRDHIASMINTLVLVYAGAALPLFLLFVDNTHPFMEVVNYEIIAEEIIRTLVGSLGLIMAVPITTFLSVNWGKS